MCPEELNSTPFGSWNLLENTLNCLKCEEAQEYFTCDLRYLTLVAEVQKKKEYQFNELLEVNLDCLNDFHVLEEVVISKEVHLPEPTLYIKNEETTLSASALTSKLINIVKQDEAGVQEIIDILSKVSVELLQTSLSDAWKELKSLEDKQNTIKLLSAYQSSLGILCHYILLPELKQEDNFYSIMEVIIPVIQWLEVYAISDLFIPLLAEGESLSVRGTDYFKDIISKLSSLQKNVLVSYFITLMENNLTKNYLQFFVCALEEVPLKVSEIPRLVTVLNRNISNFKDDRYLGKILLIIVDSYSSSSLKSISKDLVQLCSNFKGVMRFRINAALKKKI